MDSRGREFTRRCILKGAVGVGSLFVLSPILKGCAPPVNPTVVQAGGRNVASYLDDFATQIGAGVVAAFVADWIKSLSSDLAGIVQQVNSALNQGGFTNLNTKVYNYGNAYFYGATNIDQRNACAPFVVFGSNQVPMIEGPVLMGVIFSAMNWKSGNVSPGDGLVPMRIHQNVGSQFEQSASQPLVYGTAAGSVEVDYTRYPNEQRGLVSVVSRASNGGVLHGEDYVLNWT